MEFNVVRKCTYKLTEPSLESFKERMLEYLEDEMWDSGELKANENFPYTIDNIPDGIVMEVLADAIQDAFECNGYYRGGGVQFDDYFGTVSLDCGEDDVSDAVYEAVANWRAEMEG